MERDINKNNIKFNVKDINNLSYSNFNKANFSETRNEFYRNASDIENYNTTKGRNIQFTNVDNSNWNYDNYTLEQNCDMNGSNVNISSENNASNETNVNNANTNLSDYAIINYQKKINEFNNNLIKQNYMGYLDSNGVNSNNVYHKINKMNNENPPFNIISNNTDNNAQHFNAMKYSDYYNSNNCIYNTSMLNTSVSYNAKNYLNNSIPCKNDYLKLNLNSVNNVSNHLNFSNMSNSNNVNSNPFNSNITTSSLNLINYKNSVNSNNMNYTPNMLSLEHTGNINIFKGKNYNLNQFNVINLQESDLSNYSYRNFKNVNLKSNYPTSSCNMISNDIDSNIYICSNNTSNYSNKKQLKIKSINCNDSDVIRKKINSLILSESNPCSNDKLGSLADENVNSEQENIKYDNKNHSNITMENKRGKGTKIKNTNLINHNYDNQNKRSKVECVIYDNSRNPINLNEDVYDKNDYNNAKGKCNTNEKKKNKAILKKKKSNIKNITNSSSNHKISKNAEKNRDFVKAISERNSIGAKEQVSNSSNKKQIIVNKRNSYVLRKIINIQTAEDKIEDELSCQNNGVKTEDKKNYSGNNLIKCDEEKDCLKKNKNTSQENNSSIVKSLSKYDFLMNKNVIIDTVNVGNKRRGNNIQTKCSDEKYNNELSEEHDTTHLIDKKRKFNDINEHKNNSKNGKYNGTIKSCDINENKIKKYHDEKNPEDKKISSNKNETQINSKKEMHKKGVTRDKKKNTEKKKTNSEIIKTEETVLNNKKYKKITIKNDTNFDKEESEIIFNEHAKENDMEKIKFEDGKETDALNQQKETNSDKNEYLKKYAKQNEQKFYKIKDKEINNIKSVTQNEYNEKKYLDHEILEGGSINEQNGKNKIIIEEKYNTYENNMIVENECGNNNNENKCKKDGQEDGKDKTVVKVSDENKNNTFDELMNNNNNGISKEVDYNNECKSKISGKYYLRKRKNEINEKDNNEELINETHELEKEKIYNNNENYYVDTNQMDKSYKGKINVKENTKVCNNNSPNYFVSQCNKKNLSNSINLNKENKCDINNTEKSTMENETIQNICRVANENKIEEIKTNMTTRNEYINDKGNYKIAKSVIDANNNSSMYGNYDKKNSDKNLVRDLYSYTDGNNNIINNKKNKFWVNLGSISYVDSFVGKGSYGNVRKVLYNVDLNGEYLKFYINKINSSEFSNLVMDFIGLKNMLTCNKEMHKNEISSNELRNNVKGLKKDLDNYIDSVEKNDLNGFKNNIPKNNKEYNCLCCYRKKYFEMAIKEIDVSRKGNEFQFLREQELLCHFNSNVIKPLSTKVGNLKEKQNYEILMHCANGDLRKLLQNLIYHRKKEYEKRKKINKILKLMHIIFGKKYKCYKNENDKMCIGLCYEKLKKIKIKLNNSVIEIKYPKFDYIYDNIKAYNCGLTESECKFLFFQIVNGISFLQTCYQSNIIRLTDIKLQNILVFTDIYNVYNPIKWHLCISDFGCSAMEYATFYLENSKNYINAYKTLLNQWKYQFKNQLSSYFQGTVYTMAPEGLCYDHMGNFRQSKYNKLIYFYEQNFGNIEDRFQELQMPLVSIKNSINNFNILNVNSSSNFHFLEKKDGKYEMNNTYNDMDADKNGSEVCKGETNKNSKKKSTNKNVKANESANSNGNNTSSKKKGKVEEENNDKKETSDKINLTENNKMNSSPEYLPFDVRSDSWSLGIILADLGKCGIGSYEYMISEKGNGNNNISKGNIIDLNNIILNDLNILDDEENFYLQYIMNYYDILSIQWDNDEIENDQVNKNADRNKKRDNSEMENKRNNDNSNNNGCTNNNYSKKQKNKSLENNNSKEDVPGNNCFVIDNANESISNEVSFCKDKPNAHNNNYDIKEETNNNKNAVLNNQIKSTLNFDECNKIKGNNDNSMKSLELFTKYYKSFILKYKDYIKIDKIGYIKNEFVKYYKLYKHMMNENNIERILLLLFLIIINNLTYNYSCETQSFLKIELTIKNIGSGIFKFRNKKEKERYLQEFKANIQKDYMTGNKEYWNSRLTNKYLAVILKDVCYDNFANRKKGIKKCFNKFEYPLNYSDDYWNLLADLLNYMPYERLLACEVIGHDFFSPSNEKIKNIKMPENENEYVDLFDKKEFSDKILKNYIQEKKEKKYICKPFHDETETDTEASDYEEYVSLSSPLKYSDQIKIKNTIMKGDEKKCDINLKDSNNIDLIKINNLSSNEKIGSNSSINNTNQNKKAITSLYDTIIRNMKHKCDFCDNITNCLNYKNILKNIAKLENNIFSFQDNNRRNIKNIENMKKHKFFYPSNICNNVYYFLNEISLFNEFANLDIFMNIHLPIEHLCLPLNDEKTVKNKYGVNFFFKPIYFYSFPYKIIHAWYTGPLHIYLKHPNIPDYIKLICLRESNVLRRKEIIFWCCEDIILKSILKIKKLLNCSNDFLSTPYVSHLIGKQLIIRKRYLLNAYKTKNTL
ncbi:exported serine/threonine protein kinase [Plasmodium berghei]|uniref:Exported serine/threonine protein kinase n=2 Tax=Plasmodium berghei TaxID=5821 RepID=A0A509AFT9_PLABA|nr:exported serine/threonine protein kinase [Plasmodium berghei ANKA]SCM19824.1 exported serine/threonine protein kinase [Plasmodium berghei]SCN23562.1 exported serine/threonine protein kinase [Plasmodium berghei]SCO59145.1 exported serine/threonine protein kinase [Plasmodium berghei]SCO59897.1 exported serine/threonine protein kinase [Plasmodium berghei]VUC54833.1 exported serine/threonine protein kinase [Plasmodium berghei ANKA]|eukprot:XP_034420658.1 exported serine/threonine protein kinase [Plasmodium berghei ANKA]